MLNMFVMLAMIAVFSMTGCANPAVKKIDIYTFEEDRVDQKIHGNRGYVTGNVPEAPKSNKKATRTFMGVDVELDENLFVMKKKDKQPRLKKQQASQNIPEVTELPQEVIKKDLEVTKGVVKPAVVAKHNVIEEEEWVK
ncbi:MAG: hypothetical protein ABH844_00300 [Candidatus Omnitrophota bacterium]